MQSRVACRQRIKNVIVQDINDMEVLDLYDKNKNINSIPPLKKFLIKDNDDTKYFVCRLTIISIFLSFCYS